MEKSRLLLGRRAKELRKNAGLSQEEVAEKANISAKYLSRVEMGQHSPSIDTLEKLAGALHVELKDFFEFAHGTFGMRELKANLNDLIDEADEEKLRLLVKITRAVLK